MNKDLNANQTKATVETDTQTDWDWLGYLRTMEYLKRDSYLNDDCEEVESLAPTLTTTTRDDVTTLTSASEPYNAFESPLLESVGPPNILRYRAETQRPSNAFTNMPPPLLESDDEQVLEADQMGFADFLRSMNVHVSGGNVCQFCTKMVKSWPTIKTQQIETPYEIFCCNDYREFVETLVELEKERENKDITIRIKSENKLKKINKEPEQAKILERRKSEKKLPKIEESSNDKSINEPVSKLRSINYQLSNLTCMQDGWTVKPQSFFDFDDDELDSQSTENVFSLDKSKGSQQIRDQQITTKFYKNGKVFLLIFPDGSGNVYYPSGNLAILIVHVTDHMHMITIFNDNDLSGHTQLLGIFDPFGNILCNYTNGQTRIHMSPIGGVELDDKGNRKKRWLWWDSMEHVHVPPYQPFAFTLNKYISVKMLSQEKINVSFFAGSNACKFRVGTKQFIERPDCLPSGFKSDATQIFLKKTQGKISDLLRLIKEKQNSNLKLPRIPINNMPKGSDQNQRNSIDTVIKKTAKNKYLMVAN